MWVEFVPTEDQIEVLKGDLIGIFFLSAEIPYKRCDADTDVET